jgi:hypothetical protein
MGFPSLVLKCKSVNSVPRYLNFLTKKQTISYNFLETPEIYIFNRHFYSFDLNLWLQSFKSIPRNPSKTPSKFPPHITKKKLFTFPRKNLINFSQFKKMIVKVFPFPKTEKKSLSQPICSFLPKVLKRKKNWYFSF